MRPWQRRLLAPALLLTLAGGLAGCGPEASRERGEEGADTGNQGDEVELRPDDDPVDQIYHDTPVKIGDDDEDD